MKYLLVLTLVFIGITAHAEKNCRVKICNKLSRFSLNPLSHMKDSFGETCFETVVPESEAVRGKVLDSSSRWWQGSSINPTKRSVTKIKEVFECK